MANVQKLSALTEADGIVAILQPLVLLQLFANVANLYIGMNEETTLIVLHQISADLQ